MCLHLFELEITYIRRDKMNTTEDTTIQKINSFNKIHVQHQNTEMAKKTLSFFFLILYKSQWFKNITNSYFEKFFFFLFFLFFATAAKHSDCCIFS